MTSSAVNNCNYGNVVTMVMLSCQYGWQWIEKFKGFLLLYGVLLILHKLKVEKLVFLCGV